MIAKLLGLVGVKIPSTAQILAFLGAIILIASMVTYCLHIFNASEKRAEKERKRANIAESNLEALKRGYERESEKRAQQHELNLKISELKDKQLEENYQAQIAKLNIDRAKLKEDLANEKDYLNSVLHDAYELRVQTASNSTRRSEVSSNTELPTESERHCNISIARLVEAGQSCALDYASLYWAWESNCKIYGCRSAMDGGFVPDKK